MKKFKLFILLFLTPLFSFTQENIQWDTVICNKGYNSYFSYKYRNPVMVTYKLYKGGGPCKRDKFYFKNDLGIPAATTKEYTKSGYDKGHLANAEDFAFNCDLDELTFRYYNCVPQRPELNRGIWKVTEDEIRKISQKDSLLVICVNQFKSGYSKMGGVSVPTDCVKIAVSLSTGKTYVCRSFTNSKTPKQEDLPSNYVDGVLKINLSDLKRKLVLVLH
jgi:endonuclease G